MRVIVESDHEAVSRHAADIFEAALRSKPNLLFCASAGSTPRRAYQLLAEKVSREASLIGAMRVVKIDEWGGLQLDHPSTCETDLKAHLLEPLRITGARYCRFDSNPPDPVAECRRVSGWLEQAGPIDLCVLGIGTNGHIAMNEPADVLPAHAYVVALAPSSLQHSMLTSAGAKPTYGLTLGPAEILKSCRIVLLASGPSKREVLSRLGRPEVTTQFPASLIHLHPNVTVICDRAATGS